MLSADNVALAFKQIWFDAFERLELCQRAVDSSMLIIRGAVRLFALRGPINASYWTKFDIEASSNARTSPRVTSLGG